LIVGLIVAAIIWNLTSPEGESIPWQGWFVSSLTITATIVIVVAFYWQRAAWLKLWAYRILGVDYYYRDGAAIYPREDVEQDLKTMLDSWVSYYEAKYKASPAGGGGPYVKAMQDAGILMEIHKGTFIKGATCIFRPEKFWEDTTGPWTRKVVGLAGWNWAMVGQGDRILGQTAHRHEMAHVHINHYENKLVPEDEAHQVFQDAKIG